MGMNEIEQAAMDIVDDALQTYPLEPAPASIFPVVMKGIEIQKSLPKFKLSWLDYALSAFFAGMAGLVLFLWQSASLSPNWTAELQKDLFLWWQGIRLATLHIQPIISAELFIICLLFLMFGLIYLSRRRAPLVRITP